MLMRFGQAAMLAATLVLAMNSARAADPPAKGACKDVYYYSGTTFQCCKDGTCCKDGKCCKDAACCKAKECCKGACGADCGCSCAGKSKHVKKAAVVGPIIVVMPMAAPAMPVHFGCPMCPGMTMAGPLPPPPGLTPPMMMPHPLAMPMPPCPGYAPCSPYGTPVCAPSAGPVATVPRKEDSGIDPCMAILSMMTDLCSCHSQPFSLPAMCMLGLGMAEDLYSLISNHGATMEAATYVQHPPQCVPPSSCPVAVLPPPIPIAESYSCPVNATSPMLTCSAASPAPTATKFRIVANADNDRLEMSTGDDTCMACKKMVVKVGDNSLTLTRIDGQVRIRATLQQVAELKAKADCIRTDRKDRVVLEGDVEMRYSKDGQCAKVTAERIELNLATGSVTIQSMGLERIGVNFRH